MELGILFKRANETCKALEGGKDKSLDIKFINFT